MRVNDPNKTSLAKVSWSADDLGSAGALVAPRLWSDETRIAWRRARELLSGEEVLVPAQAVHCPPAGTAFLGPAVVRVQPLRQPADGARGTG